MRYSGKEKVNKIFPFPEILRFAQNDKEKALKKNSQKPLFFAKETKTASQLKLWALKFATANFVALRFVAPFPKKFASNTFWGTPITDEDKASKILLRSKITKILDFCERDKDKRTNKELKRNVILCIKVSSLSQGVSQKEIYEN